MKVLQFKINELSKDITTAEEQQMRKISNLSVEEHIQNEISKPSIEKEPIQEIFSPSIFLTSDQDKFQYSPRGGLFTPAYPSNNENDAIGEEVSNEASSYFASYTN